MTYTTLLVKLFLPAVFLPAIIVATAISLPIIQENRMEVIEDSPIIEEIIEEIEEPEIPSAEIIIESKVLGATKDCTEYTSLIESYDWDVSTAMQICRDESNGNPSAINWADKHRDKYGNVICVSSQGLMQVACIHPSTYGYALEDLQDPVKNVAIAYKIYEESGWCPWATYKGAGCKK